VKNLSLPKGRRKEFAANSARVREIFYRHSQLGAIVFDYFPPNCWHRHWRLAQSSETFMMSGSVPRFP
jgi:hypothetical protein